MEPILVFGMPSFAGTPGSTRARTPNSTASSRASSRVNSTSTKQSWKQARVQNLENHAEANGVVTPLERARIFLKKHN